MMTVSYAVAYPVARSICDTDYQYPEPPSDPGTPREHVISLGISSQVPLRCFQVVLDNSSRCASTFYILRLYSLQF